MLKDVGKSGDLMLSDGSRFSELIDRTQREVSLRVHQDQEIFDVEMRKIYARSWIPVAHESEIPDPGDYVRRYIGLDSCLVVRGDEGEIRVMLNACTHRGMSLCRDEQGNTRHFMCPYHGWVFDKAGNFNGAPFERMMYGDIIRSDAQRFGLVQAKTGALSGLIFANWDLDAEDFDDYLGDFKWYLDAVFDRTDRGLEVMGPPQRHIMKANWKLMAEQLPDGYHTMALHGSASELGLLGQVPNDPKSWGLIAINVSTPAGHTMRCIPMGDVFSLVGADPDASPMEKLTMMNPPGTDAELVKQIPNNMTEGQMRLLADTPPLVMGLFPATDFFTFLGDDGSGTGQLGPVMLARTWLPKAPDRFEMVSWVLVERDASPELRELTRRTTVRTFGISGILEQDDAEAWRGVQRTAAGPIGQRLTMKYPAELGVVRPEGFEGGGDVYGGFSKDDAQWAWWNAYYEAMTS